MAVAEETQDPDTWIWTAADRYFVDLVKEVHRRGLRIILDGVFTHTGHELHVDLSHRGFLFFVQEAVGQRSG